MLANSHFREPRLFRVSFSDENSHSLSRPAAIIARPGEHKQHINHQRQIEWATSFSFPFPSDQFTAYSLVYREKWHKKILQLDYTENFFSPSSFSS